VTGYDIRNAVRQAIEETDLAQPEDIAAKVTENVPSKHLRQVLEEVLRDYVRIELGRQRRNVAQPVPLAEPGAILPSKAHSISTPGSAKVRAIRDAAPRWLATRVHVGCSTWKSLGDCTYEDLTFLVSERLGNAEQLRLKANQYQQLANLVQRYKVSFVADLPAAVFRNIDAPG
jgi:hypothetical protein